MSFYYYNFYLFKFLKSIECNCFKSSFNDNGNSHNIFKLDKSLLILSNLLISSLLGFNVSSIFSDKFLILSIEEDKSSNYFSDFSNSSHIFLTTSIEEINLE